MKLAWIYKLILVPVFFTERLLGGFAGKSYCFFCVAHPTHKHDAGLIAHELQHCKQFYRTFGLHAILYNCSKQYRYKAEIEAYCVQLQFVPIGELDFYIDLFAGFICRNYKLDVFREDAYMDLKEAFYG